MRILIIADKNDAKILRKPPKRIDFSAHNKKELKSLTVEMKQIMRKANGIGLASNQIGLDMRVFVAEVEEKFYAVFNPEIIKRSEEMVSMEEGCLSVPGTFGNIERNEKVTLEGYDYRSKKIKIKAWGLLAIVFQHEVDHLNGKLFIDRAANLHEVSDSERVSASKRFQERERKDAREKS